MEGGTESLVAEIVVGFAHDRAALVGRHDELMSALRVSSPQPAVVGEVRSCSFSESDRSDPVVHRRIRLHVGVV